MAAASMEERKLNKKEKKEIEVRAFASFIRSGGLERRADMSFDNNQAIVPEEISNNIIAAIKDVCPIYSLADVYNIKGKLNLPYYDETTDHITVSYLTEFPNITAHSAKFTNIELNEYMVGARTRISKMILSNNTFSNGKLMSYVTNDMSIKFSEFIENELINGTGAEGHCQGILTGATNIVSTSTAGQIKVDDLIDLQESIPDKYSKKGIFIMNRATRAAIRKLKDGSGQYLLNHDVSARWGYTLLGSDLYTTDSMPESDEGNKAVIFGDISGISVNISPNINIEVKNDIEILAYILVGWMALDSKVSNQQKLAVLQITAT